jgi:hypothetical protein
VADQHAVSFARSPRIYSSLGTKSLWSGIEEGLGNLLILRRLEHKPLAKSRQAIGIVPVEPVELPEHR